MRHKVAIIIVNWNARENLQNCLTSVKITDYPSYEVVVVDNHSTDGSAEMLAKEFPEVHLLGLDENRGYSGGNNAGIHYAKEVLNVDYFALLNPDIVIKDKDWLIHMVGVASTLPVSSRTWGLAKQEKTSIGLDGR